VTELWSGPGCEDSPDYELVERDPVTDIGRFRKVAGPEYIGDAPGRVPSSSAPTTRIRSWPRSAR